MNFSSTINSALPNFKGTPVRQALADAGAFLLSLNTEGAVMGAELLLEHVLGLERGQTLTRPNLLLRDHEAELYADLIRRRAQGEPVAYLVGSKGFWQHELVVSSDTLIPRPETELLIESALEIFRDKNAPLNILDLGTGSGAILLTLLKEYPNAQGLGADISAKALNVAQNNAAVLNVRPRAHFIQSDWFESLLPEAEYDLIVSNPPYIRTGDLLHLQKEVRLYEPGLALNGGPDGLEHYRAIISQAHLYLKPGGWLGFETGERQHRQITAMLKDKGCWGDIRSLNDYAGHERILWARKKQA